MRRARPPRPSPIPTHAQLTRHFDATDVRLGARYGARSPAVARDRPPRAETADPAAATAPVLPPRVLVESMGQAVSITGVKGTQLQVAIGGSSAATIEWKWLTALDQLRLVQTLLKQDDGERKSQ